MDFILNFNYSSLHFILWSCPNYPIFVRSLKKISEKIEVIAKHVSIMLRSKLTTQGVKNKKDKSSTDSNDRMSS